MACLASVWWNDTSFSVAPPNEAFFNDALSKATPFKIWSLNTALVRSDFFMFVLTCTQIFLKTVFFIPVADKIVPVRSVLSNIMPLTLLAFSSACVRLASLNVVAVTFAFEVCEFLLQIAEQFLLDVLQRRKFAVWFKGVI